MPTSVLHCPGCRHSHGITIACLQIRDNEFLQRENLLLEAYLAKVDLAKIGINFEEDTGKVGAPAQTCMRVQLRIT
jgi:hypothetical protein